MNTQPDQSRAKYQIGKHAVIQNTLEGHVWVSFNRPQGYRLRQGLHCERGEAAGDLCSLGENLLCNVVVAVASGE